MEHLKHLWKVPVWGPGLLRCSTKNKRTEKVTKDSGESLTPAENPVVTTKRAVVPTPVLLGTQAANDDFMMAAPKTEAHRSPAIQHKAPPPAHTKLINHSGFSCSLEISLLAIVLKYGPAVEVTVLLNCFLLTFQKPSSFGYFDAPYRCIVHLFSILKCIPSLLLGIPPASSSTHFSANCERCYTRFVVKCCHLLHILKCTEEVIFINDRMDLVWIELCLLFYKKGGPPLYISSVTVAFLSFNNARLFPWKFQVPWTGEFCIIMFLPNSDLCFPSPAHKGLITYCQLRGKPQSSTVAQQIGLCWLMTWLAVRFA